MIERAVPAAGRGLGGPPLHAAGAGRHHGERGLPPAAL